MKIKKLFLLSVCIILVSSILAEESSVTDVNTIEVPVIETSKPFITDQTTNSIVNVQMQDASSTSGVIVPSVTSSLRSEFINTLTPIQKKEGDRPKVALVLGGGGAKGFAHLPVLEALEELDIPVDIVIGTSIGAIIGGLYCTGYSAQEITDLFFSVNWADIFQDSSVTSFERLLGTHSTYASPFSVKLGTDLTLKMGTGLLTGQNAYKMLKEMTVKIPSYSNFDDLSIPFRATTVNLLTGEYSLKDSGDMAEVIRASMSIPAVFEPFELDNKLYVDGGARENVPILVAKEMGYDIIIAVDISPHLEDSADQFEDVPVLALWQMINMPQAAQSEEANSYADLLITPKIDQYTLLSFEDGKEIYKQSKKDVEKCRDKLLEIRDRVYANGNTTVSENKRISYHEREYLIPQKIQIIGSTDNDEAGIIKQFESDIKGFPLTQSVIDELINDVYYTGNYNRVIARTRVDDNDICTLELRLDAKEAENGLLLVGGTYAGTFASDASNSLIGDANLQFRGLTGPGSAFSIKLSILNLFKAELVYLQPISSIAYFQVAADYGVSMYATSSGLESWNPEIFRKQTTSVSFLLGAAFNRHNTLLGGGGIHASDVNSPDYCVVAGEAKAQYIFNNLNAQAFPIKGFYVSITDREALPISPAYEAEVITMTDLDLTMAIPITPKFSLIGNMFIGSNIGEGLIRMPEYTSLYFYSVYDRRFFPQIAGDYKYGIHKAAGSLSLQIRPKESLTILGGQLTISVTNAIGNVWESYEKLSYKNLIWRGSLDLGIQIRNTFSIVVRTGVGSSHDLVTPFVSLDFGNIRY